jgi:cell division protein FtsW
MATNTCHTTTGGVYRLTYMMMTYTPTINSTPLKKPKRKLKKRRTLGVLLGRLLTLFNTNSLINNGCDTQLLWATYSLIIFGLLALFSASANYALGISGNAFTQVLKQVIFVIIGLGIMGAMARFPYQKLRSLAWPFGLGVAGLLLLTLLQGVTTNGSERWLPLGPFQFQPSELAKPAVVMLMAGALSTLKNKWGMVGKFSLLVLAIIALIFKQPNLSISLLLLSTWLSLLFIGGLHLLWFWIGLPAGAMAVWFQIQRTPYQLKRIVGWLDPWKDPQDIGYNIIQSYYAIASGGFSGRGFGNSIQKLYFLPFEHTDFILAVISEEMGFIGACLSLGLYTWLAVRGFNIALKCTNAFGQLLAFGITWVIIVQAVINICVATGLFPVTGVTLPLVSYGGTSVLVTLGMLGILMNITQQNANIIPADTATP